MIRKLNVVLHCRIGRLGKARKEINSEIENLDYQKTKLLAAASGKGLAYLDRLKSSLNFPRKQEIRL